MGFPDVYDYAAGKADWIAMGLPTEHRDDRPRIAHVARKDAPTCTAKDRIESVRAKLPKGWNICVVLNADRIILGLVDFANESQGGELVEEIMRPAPLTFRPGRTVEEVCQYLTSKNIAIALVSTSIGQFIGAILRDEICE